MTEPVARTSFLQPADHRYWEDYQPGDLYDFPQTITVDAERIVGFGREFDPQPFHIDPAAAEHGPYGGLIASGWHTAALMMRLYADNYVSSVASLGGVGVDELRWPRPVRPGDELRLRATVMQSRRSESKPDRGLVRTLCELQNQNDEWVFSATVLNLFSARTTGS